MKKLTLLALVATLSVLPMSAKLKFNQIIDDDDKTTVVLVDNEAPANMSVTTNCGALVAKGKKYPVKTVNTALNTNDNERVATIKLEFPKIKKAKGSYVTVEVNGEVYKVKIPDHRQ